VSDDNIIRVPRTTATGPTSMIAVWPADADGIVSAVFHTLAEPVRPTPAGGRKIRADLTAEEKARLAKYGSIEFKSAGATRKRSS
jgi:hypothetical protein